MFNEENTVKQMVLDTVRQVSSNMFAEELASYGGACNKNQGGLLNGL